MDNSCEKLNANSPTRQARLNAWFAERGLTKAQVARELGWTQQLLSMVLSGQRMTAAKREQLLSLHYNIPAELLPEARRRRKPGPRKGAGRSGRRSSQSDHSDQSGQSE